MYLSPTELSQQLALAHMRHQDLITDAQRRRLVDQANGQMTRRSRRVAVWRHWLGRWLIAWGEALQASRQPHPPLVRGPMLVGPVYSRSAAPHRSDA